MTYEPRITVGFVEKDFIMDLVFQNACDYDADICRYLIHQVLKPKQLFLEITLLLELLIFAIGKA